MTTRTHPSAVTRYSHAPPCPWQVVGALAHHGDVPDLVDHALGFLVHMSAASEGAGALRRLEVAPLVEGAAVRHARHANITAQAAKLTERL